VKLGLADVADASSAMPVRGEVQGTDADGLLVATGDGVLRLRRMQRSGGRMLAAGEFLRGFAIPAGTKIASRPMPALVSNSGR
jgi:methionyl-tRNA formyltransferase